MIKKKLNKRTSIRGLTHNMAVIQLYFYPQNEVCTWNTIYSLKMIVKSGLEKQCFFF